MNKKIKIISIFLLIVLIFSIISSFSVTNAFDRIEINYTIPVVNREDSGYESTENTRELVTVYKQLTDYNNKIVCNNFLTVLNIERRKAGLEDLEFDKELMEVMQLRARESLVRWNHIRPNGEMCFSVSEKLEAEEIAWGLSDQSMANYILRDENSKENLLNPEYKSVGIGVVLNPSSGGYFYAIGFGKNEPETFEDFAPDTSNTSKLVPIVACPNELDISLRNYSSPTIRLGYKSNISDICDFPIKLEIPNVWATTIDAKSAKWTVKDESIVSIDKDGNLEGLKVGETVLYGSIGSKKFETPIKVIKKSNFIDVASDAWYFDCVEYCYKKGIIQGATKTEFRPDKNITRGMIVTILWRMEGEPTITNGKEFSDVSLGQYYGQAVKWAATKNIVNGYNNGNFGPNDNITREQLATILCNYAKYKGKNVNVTADTSKFADWYKVTGYARPAMNWAIKTGIINGKNNGTKIDPQGTASRAEATAMIYNYCTKIK